MRRGSYRATLVASRHNPVIHAFYQRLRASGKADLAVKPIELLIEPAQIGERVALGLGHGTTLERLDKRHQAQPS